jgi:hypothetical protein|tara:strand:+ start:592 stop:879 length:288 start_codon:yes stop_codon:yes gene_type:complete
MAVGDVINRINIASGGVFVSFQPAAGVEVVITCNIGHTWNYLGLTDGVNTANVITSTGSSGNFYLGNVKLGITNTVYLNSYSQPDNSAFTGFQIK